MILLNDSALPSDWIMAFFVELDGFPPDVAIGVTQRASYDPEAMQPDEQ